MDSETSAFWQDFLQKTGRPPDTAPYEIFHFCMTEELANGLLGLVLDGKKTAATSSLPLYETAGQRPPRPGDLSVVTDWAGAPRCVIETTAVRTMPFNEMTYEICKREGEDDTLESWQQGHARVFTEEGAQEGYAFSPEMPIVFEDFKVVWRR
ncbi:MAG TPA: ASCH domain-containing protein [Candidatus Acidoferrum sp.]|nr:ASCH domain-containing protein [Candidatus Acidoferrum sp.]